MNPLFQELSQATRRMIRSVNNIVKEYGITYAQWTFLVYLHHHQPSTLVAIANYYLIKKPAITTMKNKFLVRGWIHEEIGRDQREKLISLTAEGLRIFLEINLKVRAAERNFFRTIDVSERKQLQHLLSTLNKEG